MPPLPTNIILTFEKSSVPSTRFASKYASTASLPCATTDWGGSVKPSPRSVLNKEGLTEKKSFGREQKRLPLPTSSRFRQLGNKLKNFRDINISRHRILLEKRLNDLIIACRLIADAMAVAPSAPIPFPSQIKKQRHKQSDH
jgi:hypothetical protein